MPRYALVPPRPLVGAALATLLIAALAALGCAAGDAAPAPGKRVLVLGIDGMDHELVSRLMAAGRLPHLARLAESGTFQPLGTSVPPLSPVAWSTFMTGLDPGGHGIFDFIHRDPATVTPYLSTSRTEPAGRYVKIAGWQLPLEAGKTVSLRHGTPFWEPLEERGVETTILRMPANFPPSGSASREVSGMGTPDLLGTYGTFSFYTSELFFDRRDVSGGDIWELDYWDNVARGKLRGPANDLKVERPRLETEFTLNVDEVNPVAELVLGGERRLLAVGEWSDWVPFEFELTPFNSLPAMVRFYLRSVRPEVELYASPINFDPMHPAQPISTPDSYAATLARATGRFYTQGMPEDTKGRTEGVLSADEFLAQARIAGRELEEQFHWVLDNWNEGGLLFYYFGNLDLVSHIMWRSMDPEHPLYDAERDAPYADVVPQLYEDADRVVGHALEKIGDETTLIVMSDHGFSSWRRAFHLNAWLHENGYLAVKDPNLRKDPGLFLNVDWSKTRAYGVGFNGLYVNLRGREKQGIVDAADKAALLEEIGGKLLATLDPATGEQAITKVYPAEAYFEDRGHLDVGPDLVVGYAKGTRGSSESLLGEVLHPIFSDNDEEWTGDHGMDHETVPGVLFTSRPLGRPAADLRELAAAVLAEFDVEEFPVRR